MDIGIPWTRVESYAKTKRCKTRFMGKSSAKV